VLPRGDNSFQKSRHAWLSRDLARAAAAAPAAETPEGQRGENLMHGGGGQEGRGDARRGWAGRRAGAIAMLLLLPLLLEY
jgi:hypothetical protein